MKQGSDNMRSSAMHDIVKRLIAEHARVIVYEPMLAVDALPGVEITDDLEHFLSKADLVVCNRRDKSLEAYEGPVFTRDIFGVD